MNLLHTHIIYALFQLFAFFFNFVKNKTYIFFDKNDAEEFYFEVLKLQLKTKEKIINRIDEIKYRQDKVNLHMRQNASLVDILKVPFGSVIDKEPLILPTDEEDD